VDIEQWFPAGVPWGCAKDAVKYYMSFISNLLFLVPHKFLFGMLGCSKYFLVLKSQSLIKTNTEILKHLMIKKGDKRQQPTQCRCLNVYFLAIYFTLWKRHLLKCLFSCNIFHLMKKASSGNQQFWLGICTINRSI